jgi:hypothetical protein
VSAGADLCTYVYNCYEGDYIWYGVHAAAAGLGGVQLYVYHYIPLRKLQAQSDALALSHCR